MSKKIKKGNGIFYVVISLFVMFSIMFTGMPILMAYSVGQTNNTTVNTQGGDYIVNNETEEESLEGLTFGGTIGSNIYHDVAFEGVTQLTDRKSDIDVEIDLRASTTAGDLNGIAAQYYNASTKDKICDGTSLYVDFYDSVLGFGSNFTVGTTTRKDGRYLNNTTAAQLIGLTYVGTTTEGILGVQVLADYSPTIIGADALGTYWSDLADGMVSDHATGTQPFILRNDEVLVVAYDFSGATSSESWVDGEASGTVTRPGRLHVNCINRGGNN